MINTHDMNYLLKFIGKKNRINGNQHKFFVSTLNRNRDIELLAHPLFLDLKYDPGRFPNVKKNIISI